MKITKNMPGTIYIEYGGEEYIRSTNKVVLIWVNITNFVDDDVSGDYTIYGEERDKLEKMYQRIKKLERVLYE